MVKGNTAFIIGNGAREHALSYAYEKSPHVKRIVIAGSHRHRLARSPEIPRKGKAKAL